MRRHASWLAFEWHGISIKDPLPPLRRRPPPLRGRGNRFCNSLQTNNLKAARSPTAEEQEPLELRPFDADNSTEPYWLSTLLSLQPRRALPGAGKLDDINAVNAGMPQHGVKGNLRRNIVEM